MIVMQKVWLQRQDGDLRVSRPATARWMKAVRTANVCVNNIAHLRLLLILLGEVFSYGLQRHAHYVSRMEVALMIVSRLSLVLFRNTSKVKRNVIQKVLRLTQRVAQL